MGIFLSNKKQTWKRRDKRAKRIFFIFFDFKKSIKGTFSCGIKLKRREGFYYFAFALTTNDFLFFAFF